MSGEGGHAMHMMLIEWMDSVPLPQGEFPIHQLTQQIAPRVRSVGFIAAEDDREIKLALNLKGDTPEAYAVSQVIVIPAANVIARHNLVPGFPVIEGGQTQKETT